VVRTIISVKNEVKVYEIDNNKVDCQKNSIQVLSHWNENDKVVLEIEGKCHAVSANDLKTAINNATNVNRYL